MRAFTLFEATLALSHEVVAADRTHATRTSLFLRAIDGDAEGWSECPTAHGVGVDATADDVVAGLEVLLADDTWERRTSAGPRGPATPVAITTARGLLDAAVLDLGLRYEQLSLAQAIGITRASVGFAGVVGIEAPGRAADRALELVALGASRVRVKVSPREGTGALAAVLDAVTVPVVADANGAFEPVDDQRRLDELLSLPLAWLEQPFAPSRLEHTAALAAATPVPIGLDESAATLEAIEEAGRRGAARYVCVKPSRFGIRGAIEACRESVRWGMRPYVGGYFEAGLGRAVLAAIAAAHGDLDGDVVAPCTYLTSDPCALAGPVHGRQPLHVTPGCGPIPDVTGMRVLLELVAREPSGRPS